MKKLLIGTILLLIGEGITSVQKKNSWQIIYYVRDVWSENISREANFKKNSIIIAKSFEEFLNYLEENPDD